MADSEHVPGWLNFIIGGVSGMMATSIFQPLELLKTRMQVISPTVKKSALSVAQSIVAQEGIAGFYTGISLALVRQGIYSASRFGIFNSVLDMHTDKYGVPNFKKKIGLGVLSGGVSAIIGIPPEIARIRMMSDGSMPVGHRRHYRNIFDALARIPREEGITTLWRGGLPTISRAMLINGAQLATYAQSRQILLVVFNDSIYIQFWSAMFAGLASTFASLPVDVIRNRLQTAEQGKSQAYVLMSMLGREGTGALWNGFLPAFARTGPHIVLTFIFLEQLNSLYFRIVESVAICAVQPMDLLKTRMQLLGLAGKKVPTTEVIRSIVAKEGFRGFYVGISAAVFRQATYSTSRLGTYGGPPSFGSKILIGMFSGGVGGFIGTPADLALVRMTADGRLPVEQRRNYHHVFNALSRISREEGVLAMWRGCAPTVTRAMVVNGAELGSYAQARQVLLPYLGDGIVLHACASMISGLATTVTSLPVDMIKTRVQNSETATTQLAVLKSVIKNEGFLALFSGFLPTYGKLGPHVLFTFIILEQLNALYFRLTEPSQTNKLKP